MKNAKAVALGGVLGALAVTVMFFGGLVPLSTYICPILCVLIAQTVLIFCGGRIGIAWYAMVAFLCLLLGPDKEASSLFALIGYYPIIKPKMEKVLKEEERLKIAELIDDAISKIEVVNTNEL